MKVQSKGLAAELGETKNHEKKKVKIEESCFASEFFSLQTYYLPNASCKMILLCCYNTAAEAFPKLCHVVREGERKQLLFPLSKMAEGRGKQLGAERQSGVLRPAQGRAGRFSEHLSPRFPLLTNALCPISRLSEQTNGIQLCCQSRRNPTWPTTQGGQLRL